ncbi:3-oxoadipate enol-lactonase [Oryzibacter oryziterrae]|uniref:3-oxoadipate enol-lactonase n=1 Tax=Oryzibacter oryziterrae TaxID=2766474 RepID=UPI001F00031E|nr:3-oxoadipate enol-lactonase [Oryzibacter oryziterrae]
MSCLELAWGHLHYRLQGPEAAPVLVLLNSLGTDTRMWDDLVAAIPGYRTLCLDQRGHGLSATPIADYTVEDLAADVVALLDHLGIDEVTAIGCSLGGLVAQALCLDHSARVTAAVFSNTAAAIGSAESWSARIAMVDRDGLAAMAPSVMQRWFAADFAASPAARPWATLLGRSDPEGYKGACRALAQADFRPRVGTIACPALVIAGSADQATPPDLVQDFARSVPGALFSLIEGAGHLPAIDNPKALAALLTRFLGAVHD